MTSESVSTIRNHPEMEGPRERKTIVLWFVSDGTNDRYVSLDESAARTFADTFNRHAFYPQMPPVGIERRIARIELEST